MRAVITEKDLEKLKEKKKTEEIQKIAEEKTKGDDYLTQVAKYIPAEIVTFYISMSGAAYGARTEIPYDSISWIIFAAGVIVTVLYSFVLYRNNPARTRKIAVTTLAFGIWIFSLGGPFQNLQWYHPVYGTLIIIPFTFVAPLVDKL